jgi:hypothetical protein
MRPTIEDGDWLFVDAAAKPRRGDVIVLQASTSPVVHRLISTRPWREMGDACQSASGFDPADIAGRVVAINHAGHTVSLTTPKARFGSQIRGLRSLLRMACTRLRSTYHSASRNDRQLHS